MWTKLKTILTRSDEPQDDLTVRQNDSADLTDSRANTACIAIEDLARFEGGKNFVDPLVANNNHEFTPASRDAVSRRDPLANVLTWQYAQRAFESMPKFYASDQLDAPEILPEMRYLLELVGARALLVEAMAQTCIHGWAACQIKTVTEPEQAGVPAMIRITCRVFSEAEAGQEDTQYTEDDRPIIWTVHPERKKLPGGRRWLRPTPQFTVDRRTPGVLYSCRGSEVDTVGFGYSRLEPVWNSITVLRLVRNADFYRASVRPIVTVPPHWNKAQIASFTKQVAKMDQNTALVIKAATNPTTGEIIPNLPSVAWATPGQEARQPASGMFTNLHPEWAVLCGQSYSIRRWTGDPGGAEAGADSDVNEDIKRDIAEFGLHKDFIKELVLYLGQIFGLSLPPSFSIKSHWEWQRDEAIIARKLQEEEDRIAQREQGQRLGDDSRKNAACPEDLLTERERLQGRLNSLKTEYHQAKPLFLTPDSRDSSAIYDDIQQVQAALRENARKIIHKNPFKLGERVTSDTVGALKGIATPIGTEVTQDMIDAWEQQNPRQRSGPEPTPTPIQPAPQSTQPTPTPSPFNPDGTERVAQPTDQTMEAERERPPQLERVRSEPLPNETPAQAQQRALEQITTQRQTTPSQLASEAPTTIRTRIPTEPTEAVPFPDVATPYTPEEQAVERERSRQVTLEQIPAPVETQATDYEAQTTLMRPEPLRGVVPEEDENQWDEALETGLDETQAQLLGALQSEVEPLEAPHPEDTPSDTDLQEESLEAQTTPVTPAISVAPQVTPPPQDNVPQEQLQDAFMDMTTQPTDLALGETTTEGPEEPTAQAPQLGGWGDVNNPNMQGAGGTNIADLIAGMSREPAGTGGIPTNQWLPVNSQSGNTTGVLYDGSDLFVKFRGDHVYRYEVMGSGSPSQGGQRKLRASNVDGSPSVELKQALQHIMEQGGEAVWHDLRGMIDGPGENHGTSIKPPGREAPAAGSEHMKKYSYMGSGYTPTGKSKSMSPGTLATFTSTLNDLNTIAGITRNNSAAVGVEAPPSIPQSISLHPDIAQAGSPTQAAKVFHHGKTWYYTPAVTHGTLFEDQTRHNLAAVGNAFHTRNPFIYNINGKLRVEYVTPEAIQRNMGKKVPLAIYHNLMDPTDPCVPDSQVVGTYEITGFDGEKEEADIHIDPEAVKRFFANRNETDWVTPILSTGRLPDLSTAYKCRVIYNTPKGRYEQNEIVLASVSIVKQGNCAYPYCSAKLRGNQ